jgi:hypothetical protein
VITSSLDRLILNALEITLTATASLGVLHLLVFCTNHRVSETGSASTLSGEAPSQMYPIETAESVN